MTVGVVVDRPRTSAVVLDEFFDTHCAWRRLGMSHFRFVVSDS